MPFLAWNDKLITGVETIDSDHVKMIALINELLMRSLQDRAGRC